MTDLAVVERRVWTMQHGKEDVGQADSIRGELEKSRVKYRELIERFSEHEDNCQDTDPRGQKT